MSTLPSCLQAALAAAAAAGGGTVFFPRGTYFLTQPLVVPPRTVIAGEREDLVALYFAEATPATAPAFYIGLNDSAATSPELGRYSCGLQHLLDCYSPFAKLVGLRSVCSQCVRCHVMSTCVVWVLCRWGLRDLTLYLSGFHYTVIQVCYGFEGWREDGLGSLIFA